MQSVSNLAPQPGLVSTNAFLNKSQGNLLQTSGVTTPATAGSAGSGGPSVSGLVGGNVGLAGYSLPGSSIPYSSVPSQATIAGTPGTSGGYAGYVNPATVSSVAPSGGGSSTPSIYQQNLAKYGLSSIPTGYAFNAQGVLQNGAGQEYQKPATGGTTGGTTTPQYNSTGTSAGSGTGGGQAPTGYSYNGAGQLVPTSSISQTQGPNGTPVTDLNASGNPNTATGNTFNNDVGTESQIASQPSAAFTQAQQTAQQALADLNTSKQNEANSLALNSENPIPLEFQQGRGQVIQNQYTQQQEALASEYQGAAALEGTATGQQSTQQTGLQGAAGLVAPQPGQSPATQTFNPATGQYSGLAALSAGGSSGQSAQSALANLGTTLGGETAGAAQVPLEQALAAGTGAADNITSYLQQNPDLNSSTLNLGNLAAQWASGQYRGADAAKYQTLGNYLTTFATQMAPLLAPGGTVTDASRALQQSLVAGSANNQTIQQVLAQLTAEAQATLANRASGAAGGGTVAGGTSVTSVPGGTNPPNPLSGSIFGS
jgi:hypothetical protein